MFDCNSWILEADLSSISLEKWQKTVNLLARLFHAPSCFILQHNHKGYQVVVGSNQESEQYLAGGFIPNESSTLHSQVIDQCRELYIPNAIEQPCWLEFPEVSGDGVVSYLGLPLMWPNGVPFGVLCVMDNHPSDYREPYFELISSFQHQMEADLQLLVNEQELNELSLTDDLTGIYNRRGFDTLAKHKLSVAKRYGHTFGLMYFDLDNLHSINDQLGHETGDQAIIALANALDSELRDSDIAARIGDDEFAALVFVQQAQDLENLAIRIQKKLNLLKQYRDSLPPITTSVGAKCYQADTNLDISTMLHEVDRLMFNIKHEKKLASNSGVTPKH
ncbi:MAG: sensor domain-containing diguanylate cyclase [Motiliproteus sp.]|nr:sensor domain-containing diguanylate cyclase [Motiliproteus sp.]MCW9051074.1 sensor domain-containing diguanylate cyclase [Motiliproteus sp.]